MPIRSSRYLVAILLLSAITFGCSEPEPTRSVQLGPGLLDMAISEEWELETQAPDRRVYVHKEIANLRLRIKTRAEDMGQPLRVPDVKSLIGKELNLRHGGVSTRVSLGGNAMIKYARLVESEEGEELRSEEWVIAKPFGHSHVARIEISLHIPEAAESHPELRPLIERLDKRVGDARIPVA